MRRGSRLVETRPTGHGRARGLVSSRVSGSRVDARTYAPSPEVADVVANHWMGRWDLRGQAPHVTELLGDPCVHLVFERGASRVVGVWTQRWVKELAGVGHVRATKLRPGAMRALIRSPAILFTDRIVPLGDVLDLDVPTLERELLEPLDDDSAFARLEEVLQTIRAPRDPNIGLCTALVQRITEDPSLTTAHALAKHAGLGLRALQRLFRDHVGASPKWTIRRFRLQELALRLEKGEATNLAHVAAELGYTDQAHLCRDFKAAVGRSPRAFATSVHT